MALIAVLIIGVSGGFYWAQTRGNQAGASNVAAVTGADDAAYAAAQAQYDADTAKIKGFISGASSASSNGSSSGSNSSGNSGSRPTASPTDVQVCVEPHNDDTVNYPPDVDTKLTAAQAVGPTVAYKWTQKTTLDFTVNLGKVFNVSSLPTIDYSASDQSILLALNKYFNPKLASLADLAYGEISDGTQDANSQVFAKLDGPFHRLNDYRGGSSGAIGFLKSSNASVKYHYSYTPSVDGYTVAADITGSAYASIGSLNVAVSAGYTWKDNCLEAIKDGISSARRDFSPTASAVFTISKGGKVLRNLRLGVNLIDPNPNQHHTTFTLSYHGSF